MDRTSLLENLSKLGLQMFVPDEEVDANVTLAELVKSHDPRLWELFPVALINAAEKSKFTPDAVEDRLSKYEKENCHKLFILSSAVYAYYHLSFSWVNRLKNTLPPEEKSLIKSWRNSIAHGQPVTWDQNIIDSERLKKCFTLYYQHNQDNLKRSKDKLEDFSLAYSLSQIFSPKQIELFKKKLEGLPLTKTEQEYYSRSVKKKVLALANAELHALARKLLEQ